LFDDVGSVFFAEKLFLGDSFKKFSPRAVPEIKVITNRSSFYSISMPGLTALYRIDQGIEKLLMQ
jgi:hypothetical protein